MGRDDSPRILVMIGNLIRYRSQRATVCAVAERVALHHLVTPQLEPAKGIHLLQATTLLSEQCLGSKLDDFPH